MKWEGQMTYPRESSGAGGVEGVPCRRGCSPVLACLQAASQARQRHLSSLQDYMQRCTNELYWLDQQAQGRIQYDWSDRNLNYPSRRRQYEVGALLWGCGAGGLGRSLGLPAWALSPSTALTAEFHPPEPGGQRGEN